MLRFAAWGQQVRRGTHYPVAVPGQQRLFGQCGPRVLEPGRVFRSAGCREGRAHRGG